MFIRAAIIRIFRQASPALLLLLTTTLLPNVALAEDGSAAWLRYAPIANRAQYHQLPSLIYLPSSSPSEEAAAQELQKGLSSLLGRQFSIARSEFEPSKASHGAVTLIHTAEASATRVPDKAVAGSRPNGESYRIHFSHHGKTTDLLIEGASPKAELYAVFHLLELIAAQKAIPADERQSPAAPIRWTDEWDNLNGTVERGYAGRSIFFDHGHVRPDLTRAGQYARLLASVGINGCNINNVNADLDTLTTSHLREFARIADAFRPWGVKLALSIDLTSPSTVGNLRTFDPLDPTVIAWWQKKVGEIYALIPDFGGFTVKADSEGRKGPSQYGRTPAAAANVLARALAPHHGVVLYRGFVYNNHLDWHDPKADRARAGVDNFARYDGQFLPNVIIQIKEGPIDFQAREPVSPLFANLPHTNMAIELQTTQEYTGQQRHMVWLPSMWKWVLDTDLRVDNKPSPVKDIVTGHRFPLPNGQPRLGGFISVTNVGLDTNWLHHPMALANLYGFGKLAWNPDADLHDIIDTWTRLTWGNDPQVVETIDNLQLNSWHVYEGYTGPNGMGTLTNILGYHFGPGIESAERNGWGQWFRGEPDGIGMDRTAAGTGYTQQYPPELAAKYESLTTCPDDLLLFFHHVPYTYRLHNGKTLVQSIYDTRYAAALAAAEYVPKWESLKTRIAPEQYDLTLKLLTFQAGHALVWRDAINIWFQHISNIPDSQGREGHHPNRIEAESMTAIGYQTIDVHPWETASGGKAVECHDPKGCTLASTVQNPAGTYDIAVQYFDTWRGASQYTLLINHHAVAHWAADDTLPPAQFDPNPDGQNSTRYTARSISLKPGDTLELKAIPDLRPELHTQQSVAPAAGALDQQTPIRPDFREFAPVDYIEIGPDGPITPQ